jgi:hypothetical protein
MLQWESLVEGMVVMAADLLSRLPQGRARNVPVRAYTVVGGRVTAAGRECSVRSPAGVVTWVPFEHFAAAAALGLNRQAPRP